MRRLKTYNATAQLVCGRRDRGTTWTSSVGLPAVVGIRASSKANAARIARRNWRKRGKLPRHYGKSKGCRLHLSVEEI